MTICAVNAINYNGEWTAEDELQVMRDIHEAEMARSRRHRIAMKREKKFVHELERKDRSTNYWRYCKRPFAHHKRDERVDHRVLQANAYPIRTQLQEMYEDECYEEESTYQEEHYDVMNQSVEGDNCDYEYEELFWEEDYNDDWYEDLFWGDDEECARFDDVDTCPISEEVMMMEMDIAYRQMMEQEVSECYDLAMEELWQEEQMEIVENAAMLGRVQSKIRRRRHRKGNIREKVYVDKLDAKAKEEGCKPKNFRRQSKRPHSRRYEERIDRHSRVDHRTACANAYPIKVQLNEMYLENEEMCA